MDWHLTAYHWSAQLISKGVFKFFLLYFRWKKQKDWRNSSKIMTMKEMIQNFTGFFFFFFTCSEEGYTFSFCTSGNWILILLTQGKCVAEANPWQRKGGRVGWAWPEEGERGTGGNQAETSGWRPSWPWCWAAESGSLILVTAAF